MRLSVDAWDPSYGTSAQNDGPEGPGGSASDPSSAAIVDFTVERPVADWAPIPPTRVERPDGVMFVDGVRRVDARVWVEPDGGGEASAGVCASWAAGVVACGRTAEVVAVVVGRGLFSPSPDAVDLHTPHGIFARHAALSGTPEHLWLALQQRMTDDELSVSEQARTDGSGLLVVDGPLRDRQRLTDAIGMVKTHHLHYLPPELRSILGLLAPGERTPVFSIGGRFIRSSWYVRLPGGQGPMAGLVRCECSADRAVVEAVELADWSAGLLPRYASEPFKDARAPQNLFPIGGLERVLRHRLGDARLIYRALRAAA